ncbi:MAG: ketoacyl-ACP synthase III [Sporomusaceae bacterium]|nr:ketoacyl-ACP synthase III [Sporomusaceae bacterium]
MIDAYIAGIEYALPSRCVSNTELSALHPEWNMKQIVARTGVTSRHWCAADETALDIAEIACHKLFSRLDVDVNLVDALLFCTQSPDYPMPPNACLLQARLGLPCSVAAFDYTLACSGFVYGLFLAQALIRSQSAKLVLLITAETYSKLMDPDDRGTITLFGDGAAATLVAAGKDGLGICQMGTDGSGAKHFMVPGGGARETAGMLKQEKTISMNGAAVLDFIKIEIPLLVNSLLKRSELTMDDIDLFIFHQGSKITLDYLNEMLHIPQNKRFCNMSEKGNTVSSSIPIALYDAEKQGLLKPGMQIMIVGFGVGLSWGSYIMNWV